MRITVKETIPEVPDFRRVDAGEWQAEPATIQLPGRQRRECRGYDLRRRIPGYGWVSAALSQEAWEREIATGNIIIHKEEGDMQNLPAVTQDENMSIERLKTHVSMVQKVMKEVMQKDEHYGVIPGCKKPSLWKPGAEKLSLTFRLAPSYTWTETDMTNGHKNFVTKCILTHISSHDVYAEGLGSCSTMESKYRYRDEERKCPKCGAEAIIKGKEEFGGGWVCFRKKGGCNAKFKDGDTAIEGQKVGRVEYDNPADFYNTALKMAKKRAHIDATLTATAASDIFTQDIEDMVDNGTLKPAPVASEDDGLRNAEPQAPPQAPPAEKQPQSDAATDKQKKALFAKSMAKFGDREKALEFIKFQQGGLHYWTKSAISGLLDDFDAQATLFADAQRAA